MAQELHRLFRQELESRRLDIAAKLRDIRERLEIDATGDEIERLMSRMERELAVAQADELSALLRQVEDALLRIDEGTYGECVRCGNRIRPKRLEVVPWAALCIACQEAEERAGEMGGNQEEIAAD
jgi:DnaK suppressor protein